MKLSQLTSHWVRRACWANKALRVESETFSNGLRVWKTDTKAGGDWRLYPIDLAADDWEPWIDVPERPVDPPGTRPMAEAQRVRDAWPELLAACEAALAEFERDNWESSQLAVALLRGAILKSKGNQ